MYDTISKVDTAFLFIFGVSFAILLLITLVTIAFLFRYNHKKHPEAADIEGNVIAEFLWTFIPTLIVLAMFWFGWQSYKSMRDVPANAMEIKVTARMWSWKFEYPNGKTSNKLIVPENTPVKLEMTSVDVIHSFYVPAFRIKRDTVPGMQTYVWFNSGKPSQYDILCAEYCGVRHSYMLSKVVVEPKDEYEQWVNAADEQKTASDGMAILEKHGCLDCHSLDGTIVVGPSLKGLYGRETAVTTPDGKEKTVTADENYISQSIMDPGAEVVKGYDNMMPPFKDVVTEPELEKLIDFFKNGGGAPAAEKPGEKGAAVAENEGCLGCHSTDGSILVGPSFKNLMDSDVTAVKDGKTYHLKADPRYIISSIEHPAEYIVEGFDASMPSYQLSDEDMKALIEYINTLKD